MKMKYIKLFEKYNNNTLNELIVKYFNDNSEDIIEIINSYEKKSDVENILEKISFIIESVGDVELIEKDGKSIAYYINMKEVNKKTFIFDIENEKFYLNSYKNYMDKIS